jgi:hypothetical protein
MELESQASLQGAKLLRNAQSLHVQGSWRRPLWFIIRSSRAILIIGNP